MVLDGETIETTPEHPFYTLEEGWLDAEDLEAGMHVPSASGEPGVVESVDFSARPAIMYNLTVEVAHTFFVGEGEWLVHNDNCTVRPGVRGSDTTKPGPFAAASIPARSPGRRFNAEERSYIQEHATQCHTCGAAVPGTKSGNWVLDNQPVTKLSRSGTPQRLYPHCTKCSAVQGGYTSSVIRKSRLKPPRPSIRTRPIPWAL